MKLPLFLAACIAISACNTPPPAQSDPAALNRIAAQYVRLGLTIGQYDADFVDAYYGPDSLKPVVQKNPEFPKDSLLAAVNELQTALKPFITTKDSLQSRADWLTRQLTAFSRRIKIFSGERASFDEESRELFGVTAPTYGASHFKTELEKLAHLLPGTGSIADRYQALASRFVIPKNKIDTVFKTAIAEARKRTNEHFDLPAAESFRLEYVTGKPWSGYNYYKGDYQSLIQINTDLSILIDRAIDVGSHESYPGHHVYNMLLEKNLYRDRGYVEISLYPLFSPQSLIAEGSAQYGIEVAFPGKEKVKFAREVLLPLAGLDTTGITQYFDAIALKSSIDFGRNEAGRGIVNGTMTDEQAVQWLTDYCLYSKESAEKSVRFIKHYGSYVINYNYGQELIRQYIESRGGTEKDPAQRWKQFGWLLSNQVPSKALEIKN